MNNHQLHLKRFILTKWYVNFSNAASFINEVTRFILTKWYVNYNMSDNTSSISSSFILTKWYVNSSIIVLVLVI